MVTNNWRVCTTTLPHLQPNVKLTNSVQTAIIILRVDCALFAKALLMMEVVVLKQPIASVLMDPFGRLKPTNQEFVSMIAKT